VASGNAGNAATLPKGRQKGCKNKVTTSMHEMIRASLDWRGGLKYLNGLDDQSFCRLLAKTIPQVIEGNSDAPITVVIKKLGEGK
jgi:hypothetical protein